MHARGWMPLFAAMALFGCSSSSAGVASGAPDASTSGVCASGEFRCTGDVLERCADDLSRFATVASCLPGLCDAAGKQCDACKAGQGSCLTTSTIRACSADGQTQADTACAPTTPFCQGADGAARCLECRKTGDCAPSVNECALSACSADGGCGLSSISKGSPCGAAGSGKSCDGKGACVECEPGAKICKGTQALTCNASGLFDPPVACGGATPQCAPATGSCVQCTVDAQCTTSNPCLSAACTGNACGTVAKAAGTACSGGTCDGAGKCSACSPGTKTCNGTQVLTCNSGGQYDPPASCGGPTPYCDASSPRCVECTAASQCATPANACLMASCTAGACGIGTRPAGTACSVGADLGTCAGGACQVCVAGTRVCSGSQVRTCNAAGQYDPATSCGGATPYCDAANPRCVECTAASQCATPANACLVASCASGACGIGSAAAGTACSVGVDAGTCAGGACRVCTTGQMRCKAGSGSVPQTCDASGLWVDGAACVGTQVCSSGACTACLSSTAAIRSSGATIGQAGPSAKWALGAQGTIEFWVRFNALSASVDEHMAVSTAYDDSSTGGWYCYASTGQVSFALRYADASAKVDVPSSFSTGVWHHVACQYDGAQMRVYVDGAPTGSRAATGSFDSYTGALLVAHRNKWWVGSVHALDARGVRVLNSAPYASSFSPAWLAAADPGTVALYRLDEGTGAVANEATNSTPPIIFSGAASWTNSGPYCP